MKCNSNIDKILICLFFLILNILYLNAQNQNNNPQIESISIQGLKKTKERVISRLLNSKVGSQFNPLSLKRDAKRINNLDFIQNVQYKVDTLTNQNVNINLQIQESISVLPIIGLGSITGNSWFQIGATDINFLGLGHQITTYYLNNGGLSGGLFDYRFPNINGSPWGLGFNISRWASPEPVYFGETQVNYNYFFSSIGASGIYEINHKQSLELGYTYFIETYEKLPAIEQSMATTPGPALAELPKSLIKFTYHLDRVNYHFFMVDGLLNTFRIENVYNFQGGDWFHVFKNDLSYYKRIKKRGNLALRLRVGISNNDNTPFAPFVLDSQVNIRGVGNRRDRGTATLTLNSEYRFNLIDVDSKSQFGGQIVGFIDIGSWRSPGGQLSELFEYQSLEYFTGIGLRLIYKRAFNAIFRIDYGVSPKDINEKGIVLGVGQYF